MSEIELDLEAPAYGGSMLARHQGRAAFVAYGLPGERVRARLRTDKRDHLFAEAISIERQSPERIEPHCPHYGPGRCGGCHYQHAHYAAQLVYKQRVVTEQFARIAKLPETVVHPTLPSPDAWRYRAHATFHVTPGGKLGYIMTDGRSVLAIDACPLLMPALAQLYDAVRGHDFRGAETVRLQVGTEKDALIAITPKQGQRVDLDLPGSASVCLLLPGGRSRTVRGAGSVHYRIGEHRFRVTAGSFFQVNPPQAAQLVRLAADHLQVQPGDRVLDLYAGVGLFSAPLAQRGARLVAVESFALAALDARHNLAGMTAEVMTAEVEHALGTLDAPFADAVLDPPRAGLKPAALAALTRLQPDRIAYVSCDPTTLARDARRLVDSGYRLLDVQPVDMFPQTYHIECVARFTRA